MLITLLCNRKTLANKGFHRVAFKIGSFQSPFKSTAYDCSVRYRTYKNDVTHFARCSKKFVHK